MHIVTRGGGDTCPAYYADANVTFSWDGDHSWGSKYGCKADGSTILGTGSLTPSTSYGESGSNGVSLDGINGIIFATSGDAQINDAIGTIWIRIIFDNEPDNDVTVFEGAESGDPTDTMYILQKAYDGGEPAELNHQRAYYGNSEAASASCSNYDIPTGSFQTVAYSWDRANGDHSAHNGTAWDDDDDELVVTLADFDEIVIGEDNIDKGVPGAGYIYIDRIVIMSTYKAAAPANW